MRICLPPLPHSFGSMAWTRAPHTRPATPNWTTAPKLAYATREGRAIVTANVVDFIELAHEAVATNTEHAGNVLVPSSFRGDEFPAIANAKPYRDGLGGLVLYIRRG